MNCTSCRETLSAMSDGEADEVEERAARAHLHGCGACRDHQRHLATLHRRVRLRPAETVPDLTAAVLARMPGRPAPAPTGLLGRLRLELRVALALVATLQLVLVVPLFTGSWSGSGDPHATRELGAFAAALAVGFLVAALQPGRARGLLPVAFAAVILLAGVAVVDVAGGVRDATAEVTHLLEALGAVLLWALSRSGPAPVRHPREHPVTT